MEQFNILSGPPSIIGWGSSERLSTVIREHQPTKILIVADPVLHKIVTFQGLLAVIRENGIPYDTYTDIAPEPTLRSGEQLVAYARSGQYSLVIGIGGGSALDLAKLAAVFATNEGDIRDYLNLSGTRKIQRKGLFNILIPTTSGTGSEVTDISVLSLDGTKDVITHPYLQADLAVVDPRLTVSVPPGVTASTGADALTHAIEAYLSVNSTPYSDALAIAAIRLIAAALPQAVRDGADKEARIAMSHGSYLAGLSFYNAGVGAIHALAYPLGGEFHVAHGDSNAVMMPYVLDYIREKCASRLVDILQAMKGRMPEPRDHKNEEIQAIACVQLLKNLIGKIGIPPTLQGFGIPESALQSLAAQAIKQQRLLARCPMELSEADIFQIYVHAFYGDGQLSN